MKISNIRGRITYVLYTHILLSFKKMMPFYKKIVLTMKKKKGFVARSGHCIVFANDCGSFLEVTHNAQDNNNNNTTTISFSKAEGE